MCTRAHVSGWVGVGMHETDRQIGRTGRGGGGVTENAEGTQKNSNVKDYSYLSSNKN